MANEPAPNHYIVRTRGLPYEATKNEVIQFLSGCCVKNDKDGVHMLVSPDGRPTGEALVELETQQDFENALKHDRQNMGRRYIEVMAISKEQMDTELSRQPGTVSLLVHSETLQHEPGTYFQIARLYGVLENVSLPRELGTVCHLLS